MYGEEIVNAVGEAGPNMADLMWQADNGGDISQHYDALAQAIGVPKQVVENVSKAQAAKAPEAGVVDEHRSSMRLAVRMLSIGCLTGLDPTSIQQWLITTLLSTVETRAQSVGH